MEKERRKSTKKSSVSTVDVKIEERARTYRRDPNTKRNNHWGKRGTQTKK